MFVIFSFRVQGKMVSKTLIWTIVTAQFALTVCHDKSQIYTNKWLVQIKGDTAEADKLAQTHGFVNEGQVGQNF